MSNCGLPIRLPPRSGVKVDLGVESGTNLNVVTTFLLHRLATIYNAADRPSDLVVWYEKQPSESVSSADRVSDTVSSRVGGVRQLLDGDKLT